MSTKKRKTRRRLPVRLRKEQQPPYEGRIKDYGLKYLWKNHWRIAAMCASEDIEQEAFYIYWRVHVQNPGIVDVDEFMRVYRVALAFRVKKHSKACFPNPYNVSVDGGRSISTTLPDGSNLLERLGAAVYSSGSYVEEYLDVASRLPDELRAVYLALVRDALELVPIPSRLRRRLNGTWRREDLNRALAKMLSLPQGPDWIARTEEAVAIHGCDTMEGVS